MRRRTILDQLALLTILLVAIPATPQDADPPRRVARLGYAGGPVSLAPAGLQDWTPAEINRPITTGDRFWSGPDGRGELQTDNAALRLGARTSLVIQELSNQATQVQLTAGTLSIRLHALAPGESFEVDTPQVSINLRRLGAFRVDAGEKGETRVTVRFGEAEVFKSDGVATPIPRGMQARIEGSGIPRVEVAPSIDEFDAWCIERDRREDMAATAHYVSRDIPGYADLDERGTWRTVAQYGAVWFPSNMDPDWAPYRSGHYVWTDAWGMNWVDAASWGFGPLHYGRWAKVNAEWGWVPGTAGKVPKSDAAGRVSEAFGIRPYYAPALVAWANFPAGVVQPGAVTGWFPLAPGEVWVPGFRATSDYITRVNLSNTAILDRTLLDNPDRTGVNYMYCDVAMTATRYDDLQAGRSVSHDFVRVPQTTYAQAMVGAQPLLLATREARIGPRGPAEGAPADITNRAVVTHRMPSTNQVRFVPREAYGQAAVAPTGPSGQQDAPRSAPAPVLRSASPAAPRSGPQSAPRSGAGPPPPVATGAAIAQHPAITQAPGANAPAAPSGGLSGLKGLAGSVKSASGKVIHGSNRPTKGSGSAKTETKAGASSHGATAKPTEVNQTQQPKQP